MPRYWKPISLYGGRVRKYYLLPLLSFSVLAQGCSIHPLPEDFSRSSTIDIVESIRCEAQAAIWDHAQKASPVKGGRPNLASYRPMKKFEGTFIGYEFQFTISEENEKSGSATFALPFQEGKFSLGVSGGKKQKRESDRNFKFVETFEEIIAANCAPLTGEKNFKYPITGEIGLGEVIHTFIRLEQLTSLDPLGEKKAGAGMVATFSDKLTFTTSFGGDLNPSVEMTPGPLNSLRLARASANISADRFDTHKVTVALAVSEKTPVPRSLAPGAFVLEAEPRRSQPMSARDRVLFELDRQRLLENDERILDLVR
jgi:hypothetical protein